MSEQAYSSERQAEDFKTVIDAYNVKKPFVATWYVVGSIECYSRSVPIPTVLGLLVVCSNP